MGCLPSKQQVLEADVATTSKKAESSKAGDKLSKTASRPVESLPPWVTGHKVFVLQNGSGEYVEKLWAQFLVIASKVFIIEIVTDKIL